MGAAAARGVAGASGIVGRCRRQPDGRTWRVARKTRAAAQFCVWHARQRVSRVRKDERCVCLNGGC